MSPNIIRQWVAATIPALAFSATDEELMQLVSLIAAEERKRCAELVSQSRKPLSHEQIIKIIQEQCALTGWKVPPTIQVARAVEHAHGIYEVADAHE